MWKSPDAEICNPRFVILRPEENSGLGKEGEAASWKMKQAREAGQMYVSIMERKGIEKDVQLGRTDTAQNLL